MTPSPLLIPEHEAARADLSGSNITPCMCIVLAPNGGMSWRSWRLLAELPTLCLRHPPQGIFRSSEAASAPAVPAARTARLHVSAASAPLQRGLLRPQADSKLFGPCAAGLSMSSIRPGRARQATVVRSVARRPHTCALMPQRSWPAFTRSDTLVKAA